MLRDSEKVTLARQLKNARVWVPPPPTPHTLPQPTPLGQALGDLGPFSQDTAFHTDNRLLSDDIIPGDSVQGKGGRGDGDVVARGASTPEGTTLNQQRPSLCKDPYLSSKKLNSKTKKSLNLLSTK